MRVLRSMLKGLSGALALFMTLASVVYPVTGYSATLAEQLAMIQNDIRFTRNAEGAVIINVPAGEVSSSILDFAGQTPIVWARYNPSGALGRIDVSRVERAPNGGVNVVVRQFTPEMGQAWANGNGIVRHYGGLNPFAQHAAGDGQFHNISQAGLMVAMGHAMRMHSSSVGFFALPNVRTTQDTTKSGGMLRKKVTTTVRYFVRPAWFAATSMENARDTGFSANVMVPGCTPSADPVNNCVARAGVTFVPFDGGNMPNQEYLAKEASESKSGFTFLAMILVVAAVAFLGVGAITGTWGWSATAAASQGATGGATIGAAQAATYAGAGYFASTNLMNGWSPLTQVQKGFMGDVSDGYLAPTGKAGDKWDPTPELNAGFVAVPMGSTQGGLVQGYTRNEYAPVDYGRHNNVQSIRELAPQRAGALSGIAID